MSLHELEQGDHVLKHCPRDPEPTGARAQARASSSRAISAPGAVRLASLARTWPGPASKKRRAPRSVSARIVAVQRTGRVSPSARSRRGSVIVSAVEHETTGTAGARKVARSRAAASGLPRGDIRVVVSPFSSKADADAPRLRAVAELSEVHFPVLVMPPEIARVARIREAFGIPGPMSVEGYELMSKDWRFSSRKAKRELGYEPRPLDETLRATVEWYEELIVSGAFKDARRSSLSTISGATRRAASLAANRLGSSTKTFRPSRFRRAGGSRVVFPAPGSARTILIVLTSMH